MRVFDPEVLVRDFRELGFSEEDHQRWKQMTERPNGIVLVTGPTGSGKTTTLYSTLKSLATPEVNVCTIEDPIEMVEPAFNQMQVHSSIGLGFAEGVRALMRQDPDIIMVGEIRDFETAEMAVQAALTGHLVLSTLHTNDAPSAVTRLLELPSALPVLFGGLRVGVTLAVIGAVVAEWTGASVGLGVLINIADQGLFDTPLMFVALGTLALLGLTFYGVVLLAERALVPR